MRFIFLLWICRIFTRASSFGFGSSTFLSKRPERSSAGSKMSGRFVAAVSRCCRELDALLARDRELDTLFERLYEDNVSGKIDDARFAKMAKRYEQEQGENAGRIKTLRLEVKKLEEKRMDVDDFLETVRHYTNAAKITKRMVAELIDHIDVYETQGTGKNKTQRLVIYYKFVGYLDIDPTQCHPNYTADIREGVAIEYVSCEPSDSLKELFSEGYNADDDSFEEEEMEQA